MSSTVFLVGPSRIGKSCAANYAATFLTGVRHHDLDADLRPFRIRGLDNVVTAQDWSILRPLLCGYESVEEGLSIVDIGAGTQNMVERGKTEILEWVRRPASVVILLTAEVDFAWRRWIDGRDSMKAEGVDRFVEQEFTCRKQLYSTAQHIINVTDRTRDEVGEELVGILKAVLQA